MYLKDNFNNFINTFIKKLFNEIIYNIKFHDKSNITNIVLKN